VGLGPGCWVQWVGQGPGLSGPTVLSGHHLLRNRNKSEKSAIIRMKVMKTILFCLGLVMWSGHAVYEDQVGSSDRFQHHIGPIDFLYHVGKSAVVGTGANVAAVIGLRTGEVASRFVVPEGGIYACSTRFPGNRFGPYPSIAGERLLSLVPSNEAAVVLTQSYSHCILRLWSLSPAQVLWEASFKDAGTVPQAPYSSSQRQLLAVSHNVAAAVCGGAVYAVETASGRPLFDTKLLVSARY
jgi:hypothetical protein